MMLLVGWLSGVFITIVVIAIVLSGPPDLKRLGRKLFRRVWKARCSKCGIEYRRYSKGFWLPRRIWIARHRARCHGDHEDVDKPSGRPEAPKLNPKYLQP